MGNRRILLWVIVGFLMVAALGGGVWLAYVRLAPEAPPAITEGEGEPGGPFGRLLVPQGQLPSASKDRPEWSLAGIVQRVDAENKFFEIKTSPLFPVLLDNLGFSDGFRIYFDDDMVVVNAFVETENGVVVKTGRWSKAGISSLVPGKPVRVFGEIRKGVFFAKIVNTFDYKPQ